MRSGNTREMLTRAAAVGKAVLRANALDMFHVVLRSPVATGFKQAAAVDDEAGAGDEVSSGEEGDRLGDVFRVADPLEQGLLRAPLFLTRIDRDGPRRDAAHSHLRRERAREDTREHRLRRLRRGVRRERRPGLIGRDVLDQDQDAAPGSKVRRRRLGEEEAALRGNAEGRVPVLLCHVLDRFRLEPVSGRMHDQVEATELFRCPLDQSADFARAGEVTLGAARGEDRPAFLLEPPHDGNSQAARTACDEGTHRNQSRQPEWGSGICIHFPIMFLMKTTLALIVALLAATITPSAFAATRTVDITRTGFTPDRLTIDFGDTVTWTNKDSAPHSVVADGGAFTSSPVLQPNQTYSFRFVRSGTFGYRDGSSNERGRVTVRQGVTLAAAAPAVRFGASMTLSGVVSSGQAGETVSVMAQACGSATATQIGTATSGANGAWSLAVKPTLNTVYEARWRNTQSAKVEVKLAPRVGLVKLRAGRFSARVTAASSLAGKYVVLQRYATTRRRWVTVKRVVLRTAGAPVAGAVTTRGGFTSRLRRGTRLRLVLPQSQAGTCQTAAQSGLVRA